MTDAQLFQILILNAHFRTDFGYNLFKVQNRDQSTVVFGDTGGYTIFPAIDNAIRLFDFGPGDPVDPNNGMNMKSKVRIVKSGDDKKYPVRDFWMVEAPDSWPNR